MGSTSLPIGSPTANLVPASDAEPLDLVTIGETLVSFRGPLRSGGALTTHVAGAESNVAIGAARLGHRVRWVSRLGSDPFGDLVARELRAEGIEVLAERDDTRPTAVMFALAAPGGRIGVQYRRAGSAASVMTPDLVARALQPAPRALHVTGITPALSASALLTTRSAMVRAREHGALVSFDVNHRAALWSPDDARPVLRDLAGLADVVIGGDDELTLLDPDAEDLATRITTLLDTGLSEVIVKRGALGASSFWREGRRVRRADARALTVREVDPIGAGDAFTAGWLSAWLDGLDAVARLARGNALGAAAVSSTGDWEGLPSRAQLADLSGADVVR